MHRVHEQYIVDIAHFQAKESSEGDEGYKLWQPPIKEGVHSNRLARISEINITR